MARVDHAETVVITGSSGFIGQALARRLSERYRVVGLDLVEPDDPIEGMETVTVDLTSDDSVGAAVERVRRLSDGGAVASVIHLAAYYDLSGEPDPKYEAVTVAGTRRLLRALRQLDVEQLVIASTMLVHAPCEPGSRISETSPTGPSWPYPESKLAAETVVGEERGEMPALILRLAGVYDESCRAPFIARQIARIFERSPLSLVYAGDPGRGQSYLHLDDLVDAVAQAVERRDELPEEETLLLGEPETATYEELQRRIGELVHGEPWPTFALPKNLAQTGAWLRDEVLDEDPFIKPWMVALADDHYALDIGRARQRLDWSPQHRLIDELASIVAALKDDPPGWYSRNKLNAAKVAASAPVIERLRRREEERAEEVRRNLDEVDAELAEKHRRTRWAHMVNMALGAWLVTAPITYGLFDPVAAPPPPAAGLELAAAEVRNGWLGISEILSGLAIILLAGRSLARPATWSGWACAGVGFWVLMAPLVFWTTSAAAYAVDTLIGALTIMLAVMVTATPGISREALASDADLPMGWSYSPSTYVQRIPIVALAFIGLFVSRYLAAYQLGHIDGLWDPVFGGIATAQELNGSEAVVTSYVSRSFPIADAGLGAVVYLLDILAGAIGDRRRWRTMPWMVLIFGLLIIPLGAVSVGFIMIQPTLIGTLCTLCLVQTAITVILIPYSVDEVIASAQYLWRSHRVGRPFWHTLLYGGPPLQELNDPARDFGRSFASFVREFAAGGVNYPWTLVASTAIGMVLMATPLFGNAPPAYDAEHVIGCLVVTLAVTACADVTRAVRLLNVPLGLAVAALPFVLPGASTAGVALDLALGLALVGLSLPRGARSSEHYGGWDRLIF